MIDAILGWSKASVRFVPYAQQLERLERAEQIARASNDKSRLARTARHGQRPHGARANLHAAPIFAECFTLAAELGDEQLTIVPTYFMGTLQWTMILMDR